MLLRIKFVDLYGYNGREHHPSKSDIGLVCIPVKMETHIENCEGDLDEFNILDEQHVGAMSTQSDLSQRDRVEVLEVCWTVVTPDGRILELMGCEVEPAL